MSQRTMGSADAANPMPALVTLPGESGTVTAAAAGESFSLVVTSSGQLYAFGYGGEGQLGNATITGPDNATPALVSLPSGITSAVQVAAGNGQSLVIGSGTVLGWLGAGDADDRHQRHWDRFGVRVSRLREAVAGYAVVRGIVPFGDGDHAG